MAEVSEKLAADNVIALDDQRDSQREEYCAEALMLAYKAGDAAAFDQLYDLFRLPLYRYMSRQLVVDEAILNELYQDTWLKLINSRARYTVQSSFKTYLYQVAHNTIRDYFRRQSVRKIVQPEEDGAEYIDPTHSPDEQIELQQQVTRLRRALSELPAEQRDVFLLKEEAGLSTVEIAEVMQVNAETVKSRMRYAIQRLKQALNGGE